MIFSQTLKGTYYDVYMKIPTYIRNELKINDGDLLKIRIGTGYFALVPTADIAKGVMVREGEIRLPQAFTHKCNVRAGDRINVFAQNGKMIFSKDKSEKVV